MAEGTIPEDFHIGEPALVMRWRLQKQDLPLKGRLLRALGQRVTPQGVQVSEALVAWATQHIEWTLTSGSKETPDGVLMLVIDTLGRAAMSTGPFVPLNRDAHALRERLLETIEETKTTRVFSEGLIYIDESSPSDPYIIFGCRSDAHLSGCASLVADLAKHKHVSINYFDDLMVLFEQDLHDKNNFALVSDEFGVVPLGKQPHELLVFMESSYQKLLSK